MNDVAYRDYWPKEWPDWPEDPKARKAVQGAFELGLLLLNAPACHRKFRLEQADEKARKCLSQMGAEEQKQVRNLVALWEQNALVRQIIGYEEAKKGIDAANHLYPKWTSAGLEMNMAEEKASQLGLAGYEYFRSRVEHFYILQEEKDEFGRYHNLPDYSELREQWYSRKPITAPLIWPWDNMLALCKRFESRENKTKKWLVGRKLAIAGIVITIVFGVAGIVATVILDIF